MSSSPVLPVVTLLPVPPPPPRSRLTGFPAAKYFSAVFFSVAVTVIVLFLVLVACNIAARRRARRRRANTFIPNHRDIELGNPVFMRPIPMKQGFIVSQPDGDMAQVAYDPTSPDLRVADPEPPPPVSQVDAEASHSSWHPDSSGEGSVCLSLPDPSHVDDGNVGAANNTQTEQQQQPLPGERHDAKDGCRHGECPHEQPHACHVAGQPESQEREGDQEDQEEGRQQSRDQRQEQCQGRGRERAEQREKDPVEGGQPTTLPEEGQQDFPGQSEHEQQLRERLRAWQQQHGRGRSWQGGGD